MDDVTSFAVNIYFNLNLGEFNVNGDYCTKRGKKIKPGDIIEFKNKKYKIVYDESAAGENAEISAE